MKKSSFLAILLSTISVVLFSLGMCMVLLTAWQLFWYGVLCGCLGIWLGLGTILIWRHMENKPLVSFSKKLVLCVVVGIVGALVFGIGICLSMVWGRILIGALIGLIGMVILLCLIPLTKGIHN